MLTEALMALAAAGGGAVVQAADTDLWAGFSQRVARLFSRGDTQREQAELERLDRTAAVVRAVGQDVEQRGQQARQDPHGCHIRRSASRLRCTTSRRRTCWALHACGRASSLGTTKFPETCHTCVAGRPSDQQCIATDAPSE
ncbi:hypothetical protein CP981_37095 [Streptomyces platensis]|uniref:Uncharacterized protein n=1 Tax=Streptomyces platensis TaxID=58346 RepID=A0AAE6TTT7_STRPT|nr:hypothetical protein CP981_37095 [Streptomyces platensis]